MNEYPTGKYVKGTLASEEFLAFVPNPLPPNPPLIIDGELQDLIEKANISLGRLDGIATILPDISWFYLFYAKKEALLSSQIEGTQSSFSDLLIYEKKGFKLSTSDEVKEVLNYVAAMKHGLERMRGGFPLSLRLIKEIHQILLSGGREASKNPGEFRKVQNWIGGSGPGNAVYVPPPPDVIVGLMSSFEKFLHDGSIKMPVLIKAALVHVQFESIHPFLDGNGRLGRLLITFLLCANDILREPLLYLSLYIKENRSMYYELLEKVRVEGAWNEWLRFFMKGVHDTAEQGFSTAKLLIELFDGDREKIESGKKYAASVIRVHQLLKKEMVVDVPAAARQLGLSQPTIKMALDYLTELSIVREITGKSRNRLYAYSKYLAILEKGTEPL